MQAALGESARCDTAVSPTADIVGNHAASLLSFGSRSRVDTANAELRCLERRDGDGDDDLPWDMDDPAACSWHSPPNDSFTLRTGARSAEWR